MTVATTTNREQYATDGVTTVFTIHFPFFDDSDVNAILVDAGGGATTLTLSTDFSVTGGNGAGGTLTTATALPAGGTLTVFRDIAFTQEDDYVENDPLPADTLESGFDRAAMRDQQLQDAIDRALVLPVTAAVSGDIVPLPAADKFLGWNSTADALENKDLPDGQAIYSTIANTRLGTATAEAVTPDGLASLWQEGASLVSASSIVKPGDANLGGFYTQSGSTQTDSYWAGVAGGEEMEVRYTGAPVLSISGNLLPPGGANFQATAGDIIRWRWDTGASKWRAVGGMHATGWSLAGPESRRGLDVFKTSGNQAIANNTVTKVTFDTANFNELAYDFTNQQVTVGKARYLISAQVEWTSAVDVTRLALRVYRNGTILRSHNVQASGTGFQDNALSFIYEETTDNAIYDLRVIQSSGGSLSLDGSNNVTRFQIERLKQ